jgi:two-component system sensor histidine kinase/response regulator
LSFLQIGQIPVPAQLEEKTIQRKDGSQRAIQISYSAIKTETGYMVSSITRDITYQKRNDESLQSRDAILKSVAFAAEQFLEARDWRESIQNVLTRLGEATRVSRVYIFRVREAGDGEAYASQLYEWAAAGVSPQIDNPDMQVLPLVASGFSGWVKRLSVGKPVYGLVRDFPPQMQEVLSAQDILSIVVVPVFLGKQWWGFIGFDECASERQWTHVEVDALKTATDILGAVLQRHQIETALQQSEITNQAIIDAIPDSIVRAHQDGTIIDLKEGRGMEAIFSREQLVGKQLEEVTTPESAAMAKDHISQVFETGQVQVFEYQQPVGEEVRSFEVRLVRYREQECLAIFRDMSERARLEQMKSDFINRAAHDLRTPLTTTSMMAELIQEGGTEDEIRVYWQIMNAELKRQRTLVEELLNIGRLESGRFEITSEPIDLAPVIQESVGAVKPLAVSKQICLSVELEPHLPRVNGNENSLQQVFVNLLNNGIKFTPEKGKVELRAERQDGRVCILIRDTGIGISAEDLPHLFSRFFRAKNAIRDEIQGSGVGLYIVQSIVEKLGGQVKVESELDKGTTFRVWLPLAK